jgi:hypothetical protein
VINEREVQMLRRFLLLFGLLQATQLLAADISPVGDKPRWPTLERYQETMTRDDFTRLLQNVYATRGYDDLVQIGDDSARIVEDAAVQTSFTFRFAKETPRKLPTHYWRRIDKLGAASQKRPLRGLNVALDPGHLGGRWAKMEERWFQVGDQPPVEEGELTWRVARILAPKLWALGAEVSFARRHHGPTTPLRPDDFREIAREVLARTGVTEPRADYEADDADKEKSIRWQSELLFYRQSEIRYRAKKVNMKLQPDLVLCLHFNAEGWGDPKDPILIDRNHFHVLINGSYLPDEIVHDDVRYEMVRRLLSRAYEEELPLADAMATTFAQETGLPPLSIYYRHCHKSRNKRLRLCAQSSGHPRFSLPGDLFRALCHEQHRRLRANGSGRLRWHSRALTGCSGKVSFASTPRPSRMGWRNIAAKFACRSFSLGSAGCQPAFVGSLPTKILSRLFRLAACAPQS